MCGRLVESQTIRALNFDESGKNGEAAMFPPIQQIAVKQRRRRRAIDIYPKATDDCDYRCPNN